MKTIILPGYSISNKDWAEETAKHIPNSIVHYWSHWTSGGFSPKKEIEKILEKIGDEKINILAKSVGTGITNELIAKVPSQINKVILCGVPQINQERYKNFANFPGEKIICFQNTNDPWAKYAEVKEFLGSINPKIKVVAKDRSDHNYPYYQDFIDFLSQ